MIPGSFAYTADAHGAPQERKPLLSIRGLSKSYPTPGKDFHGRRAQSERMRALDDVNFDLYPGETLGLVGESGSGKTTMARCILRAVDPSAGSVIFRQPDGTTIDLARLSGRALKLLRPQMQMIFQDPFSSLNPRMTIGEIVGEPLVIHGLARGRELDSRVEDMLRRVGLEPIHRARYPHAFSGGQRQRIGIARALIMRPSLVVADEAVSALDVSVQAQVLNLLKELQAEFRLTYLFVAHNLDVVRHFCDRVAVMYAGRIVEISPTAQLFERPAHPYTKALLSAVLWPDPDHKTKFDVPGEVADPAHLPAGCAFHPRCKQCIAPCRTARPELLPIDAGARWAACHLYGPVSGTMNNVVPARESPSLLPASPALFS